MNNDGWGQVGAGQDDRRIAGDDLQHFTQRRDANETAARVRRVVHASSGRGGPVKDALEAEALRHSVARDMRLKHLEDHIKR